MRVAIEDIAEKLGVSRSTVSRALNDSTRISIAMREKIKQLAFEMGYFDNAIKTVNHIKGETPENIGVSLIDLNNPFCIQLVKGIQDACIINGYRTIIMDSNLDSDIEQNNIRNFQALNVKGMIIHGTTLDTHLRINEIDSQVPKVYLGRKYKIGEANFVCVDAKEAIYKTTEYLIQLGHRRLAFVGASEKFAERIEGYKNALAAYEIPVWQGDIKYCASTRLSGSNAMRELMNSGIRYTGIVCVNDFAAIGVMEYIRKHGFRIPEDYSVTGMDNLEISSYNGIDLTTINQPCYEIGKIAVEILINKIKHSDFKTDAYRILESHFIMRKSCRHLDVKENAE